ncbi:MAG: Ig-like domain-containing protein, partial [Bacteroidota bacterium]|nr:Ig-like domain-containing protein [Bacteroidota bacterium]
MSLIFLGLIFAFLSCSKDDDAPPVALSLQGLTAGAIDLNAATSPSNVPADASFTATFSTDVDPATANSSNVTLTRDYDDADIPVNVTTSGNTVTITPVETLGEGTLYELSLSSAIMSTGGQALPALSRTFTTEGTFVPAGQVAYWNFEDNADDQVGNYNASDVVDVTYVEGRSATFGKAASFNGNTSIIEIPNGDDLIDVSDYTLSFWVKTNSEGHLNVDENPAGHFVMGLGGAHGIQFEIPADYAWVKFATQYEFADGT